VAFVGVRHDGHIMAPFSFSVIVVRHWEQNVCKHPRIRGGLVRECIRDAQMVHEASSPSICASKDSFDDDDCAILDFADIEVFA
jgi:hypothetical protein